MQDTITIGYIGLGLIGGSIAKTIHRIYPDYRQIACDLDSDILTSAKEEGIISDTFQPGDPATASCDYLFLCAPIHENSGFLGTLSSSLKSDAIVTDVGSVKGDLLSAVEEAGLSSYFISGHPMAGSEKTGYANAKDHLLENAYYVIIPSGSIAIDKISRFTEFIASLDAIPLILTDKEHDYVTAAISHLPHLVAASLVNLIREIDTDDEVMKQVAAGGFKDITRIASSDPNMWRQICLENHTNISAVLDHLISDLIQYRVYLDNADSDGLYDVFASGQDYRNSLSDLSSGPIKAIYRIYCDLADETGGIATIATLLASKEINIRNIGIIHNREFEDGVLRIEFYDEPSCNEAASALTSAGYSIHQ